MMRTRLAALIFLASSGFASATTLSYVGDLSDPNGVFLAPFTTNFAAALDIQTFGYGGGTNGAGTVIPAGGFDPYVSLFAGTGPTATFLASNDDGLCPPGTPDGGNCFDSTLMIGSLPAGAYTLALTQPFNFSFAENLGTGTLGDGFIGLEADFSGRTPHFAVDISSSAIPEPGTLGLVSGFLLLLLVASARRTKSS